ncbi:hypothetical protein AAY473_009516 [Plecturocebus cupreus]
MAMISFPAAKCSEFGAPRNIMLPLILTGCFLWSFLLDLLYVTSQPKEIFKSGSQAKSFACLKSFSDFPLHKIGLFTVTYKASHNLALPLTGTAFPFTQRTAATLDLPDLWTYALAVPAAWCPALRHSKGLQMDASCPFRKAEDGALNPSEATSAGSEGTIVTGITGVHYHVWLIFVFLVEMRFHHVGQAGLELLTSSDPPTSASHITEVTCYPIQSQGPFLKPSLNHLTREVKPNS